MNIGTGNVNSTTDQNDQADIYLSLFTSHSFESVWHEHCVQRVFREIASWTPWFSGTVLLSWGLHWDWKDAVEDFHVARISGGIHILVPWFGTRRNIFPHWDYNAAFPVPTGESWGLEDTVFRHFAPSALAEVGRPDVGPCERGIHEVIVGADQDKLEGKTFC